MTIGNTASGTEMAQRNHSVPLGKLGRDHINYWKARLTKRSYEWDGEEKGIPAFQVRLKYLGRREWFNLGTENEATAANKAREIYRSLTGKGWEQTLAIYKPQPGVAAGAGLSITEFCDLYRKRKVSATDRPVSGHTAERYIKSLTFICRALRITRLDKLEPKQVEKFKDDYLLEAAKQKRKDESAKVSLNTQIRNAAAMFSKRLLAAYKAAGHTIANPFEGQQVRGVDLQTYKAVDQEVYDTVWRDAALLRDGDPKAKASDEKAPRWEQHDFRKPNLSAYAILLLSFGLGLRRNECDKGQRDWFHVLNGERYITVQETPHFKPKSKEARTIHVDPDLWAELKAVMGASVSPFIVPGPLPKQHEPGKQPRNIVYRCDAAHRALAAWLKARGFKDSKPIHQARKEFGSFVANDPKLGLHHAQRLLGHSSPNVTAQYYAGHKVPKLDNVKLTRKTA